MIEAFIYHHNIMEHPKVPVYVYPYTHKPTYVIKVCNYMEQIETTEMYAYYTICCKIGKPNTFRPKVCFIPLVSAAMDYQTPVYYISASLAAKLLRTSLNNTDHESSLSNYLEIAVQKATTLAQEYETKFDDYVKNYTRLSTSKESI